MCKMTAVKTINRTSQIVDLVPIANDSHSPAAAAEDGFEHDGWWLGRGGAEGVEEVKKVGCRRGSWQSR